MFLTRDHKTPPRIVIANGLRHAIDPLIERNDIERLAELDLFRHNTSLDPAPLGYTDWVLEQDSDGDLYTRVPFGTQEEIEHELNKKPPRWISSAAFVRRLSSTEWDAINQMALDDMTLLRLKDSLMTGDPGDPGNINLDAEELSQGLDYVVALGIISSTRKAELLSDRDGVA